MLEDYNNFESAVTAVAVAKPWIGYWMNWMAVIPVFSIFFLKKHIPARLAFASIFLVFPIGVTAYKITGEIFSAGIGHIIIWTPILVHIVRQYVLKGKVPAKSFYGVWLYLFLATITISLVFDFRDFYLVMNGLK